MTDYDLLVLSPIEFEDLTKDLLEKKMRLDLESFGAGRDNGIDLRYSKSKNNDLVVQCKRYKSYTSLKSALKKEKPKLQKLNPRRYMIATTVPLNPARKAEITAILSPYIMQPADILGLTEINSLISRYPTVEKKHYKLWLASSAVLRNLLHSQVMNQSELELGNVKKNLLTYAENPSYSEALKILQKNHFVIISGLPGIGKTTLARVLVYRLLGDKQFDEFVFISGSVDEAYEMFDAHKKQLFLFDDFLGTNFLEQKIGRNEDSRLLEFIKMVNRSKNTTLILTTREYILKQAQGVFRQLDDGAVKRGKYIIDLSEYTKLVKAKILYNHLFVAKMPAKYLNEFLKQKVYKSIINHKNYNPRLIEVVLSEKPWEAFSVREFPQAMIAYFDNPHRIWENIYENEISENARSILEVLLTATAPIKLEDLVTAVRRYLRSKGADGSRAKIDKALKELDGTFITSEVHKDEGVVVNFQNPSVYDFLRDYYGSARQDDLCDVIRSAQFLNQLTEVFSYDLVTYGGKISMNASLRAVMIEKIMQDFTDLKWSAYSRSALYSSHIAGYHEPSLAEKIYKVLFGLNLVTVPEINDLMLERYKLHLAAGSGSVPYVTESLELLEHFHEALTDEEIDTAVAECAQGINDLTDLEELDSAELYYPFACNELIASDYFTESAEDALINEVNNMDDERLPTFLDDISGVVSRYGLSTMWAEEAINERQREAMAVTESEFYHENIPSFHDRSPASAASSGTPAYSHPPSDDELIDSMFESLS
jgi:adenylate kinase family enzyme